MEGTVLSSASHRCCCCFGTIGAGVIMSVGTIGGTIVLHPAFLGVVLIGTDTGGAKGGCISVGWVLVLFSPVKTVLWRQNQICISALLISVGLS